MDKTKEELLKPFFIRGTVGISPHPSYDHIQGRPEEIAGAMQAYADQEKRKETIAFAEWIVVVRAVRVGPCWFTKVTPPVEQHTTEQLYDLYIQSLTT